MGEADKGREEQDGEEEVNFVGGRREVGVGGGKSHVRLMEDGKSDAP